MEERRVSEAANHNDDTAAALRELASAIRASVDQQTENVEKLERTVCRLAILVERQLSCDESARRQGRKLVESLVGKEKAASISANIDARLKKASKR